MAHKTVTQLVTQIERQLSQYAGAAVQLYSEPILKQYIQQAFDFVFEIEFWPQFVTREQRTVDGVTGLVTVPFTNIKQWDDILFVFRRYSDRPLPPLPSEFNTLDLTGTQSQFIDARVDSSLFTVYPLTSTDQIEVVGRVRLTTDFIPSDVVPFDSWAITHFCAWQYMVRDSSNPAAASTEQGLFDVRLKTLKENADPGIIYVNPRNNNNSIPQRWS